MSTQYQIFRLSQSIILGFSKKEYTGSVFFDLEKALTKLHMLELFTNSKSFKFDRKLSFKNLLENINVKAKINLIPRIKGLKLRNSIELSKIVFKIYVCPSSITLLFRFHAPCKK
ncbi:hypothetical protein BpHYR1_001824 [Brachionus plicatilis]|uniref:Uncharacterized protein n=1 Tax=Brachionus plicatilis TaxID=10195 RepID=A0A3M7SKM6_BRAPC|nr:hypothetical protein BpHYR1_001824 [Brachionus plicatilis]